MRLNGRIRKIENTFRAGGSGKNKDFCMSVWHTDKLGIFLVRGGGVEFEGKETEVREFIKPYQESGSSIVWTNVPYEWAM